MRNKWKQNLKFLCVLTLLLVVVAGCQGNMNITRENFSDTLTYICKKKYQAYISCRPLNDTIWIYLPYMHGRKGFSTTKEKGQDLYLEHYIASFNPYKTIDPPELKFLVQKILGEIRRLLLNSTKPYKFFVLVVTDIESSTNNFEDWYIGYINDLKKYGVGVDFSGEGYNRLVWYAEKIETTVGNEGRTVLQSYLDMDGKHINYHDITLKEFVEKQIDWRIYKRFTINYNKIPYDLTALEREAEVINIVKIVLTTYNFKDFDKLYLADKAITKENLVVSHEYNTKEIERLNLDRDSLMKLLKERMKTAGEQSPYYIGCLLEDIDKYKTGEVKRKPAF